MLPEAVSSSTGEIAIRGPFHMPYQSGGKNASINSSVSTIEKIPSIAFIRITGAMRATTNVPMEAMLRLSPLYLIIKRGARVAVYSSIIDLQK